MTLTCKRVVTLNPSLAIISSSAHVKSPGIGYNHPHIFSQQHFGYTNLNLVRVPTGTCLFKSREIKISTYILSFMPALIRKFYFHDLNNSDKSSILFKFLEKRLSRRNVLSYGVNSQNVYFSGPTHRGSGIEDDHIPFLRRSKCTLPDHFAIIFLSLNHHFSISNRSVFLPLVSLTSTPFLSLFSITSRTLKR